VLLAALNGCVDEHTDSATAGRHAAKVSQGAAALALANMVRRRHWKALRRYRNSNRPARRPVVVSRSTSTSTHSDTGFERVSASFQAVEGIELTKAVDR